MSDWPWDITFEVAFDVDAVDEPDPADWTDLSSRLSRADGSKIVIPHAPADMPAPATLVLNNQDRVLDPTNPASPHNLVPMRHARLTGSVGAVTEPMYRGFVEDWPLSWPKYGQALVEVTIAHALDFIAELTADVDLPAQTTGERIDALLDLAGWSATRRDIATGRAWLEPYEQQGANLLSLMLDTARSEDGILHVDPSGDVVFHDRHYRFGTAPTITFGPNDHRVAGVRPRRSPIVNIGRAEMADGTVHEVVDAASKARFGERPSTVRDLALPDVQAEGIAAWSVVRFADPTTYELDDLRTHGHGPGAATRLASLLGMRLGDLAAFSHTPPGGGDPMNENGQVMAYEHVIGKGTWTTTAPLRSWHGDHPWLVLNDPVLGLMDGTRMVAP